MIRLMHEFFEHGKRRHLADKTLKDYEVFLRAFFGFLQEAYPDITEITDVSRQVITAYEKHLLTRKDSRGKVMGRQDTPETLPVRLTDVFPVLAEG